MEPTKVYVEFAHDGSLHIRDRNLQRLDDELRLVDILLDPFFAIVDDERYGEIYFPEGDGNIIAYLECSNDPDEQQKRAQKIYRGVQRRLKREPTVFPPPRIDGDNGAGETESFESDDDDQSAEIAERKTVAPPPQLRRVFTCSIS